VCHSHTSGRHRHQRYGRLGVNGRGLHGAYGVCKTPPIRDSRFDSCLAHQQYNAWVVLPHVSKGDTVINLEKEWHDLTVEEKLDELSHAMSAVVAMAMDFEARMLDVARSGKLLSESMLVMNRAGQKDEQRITSLERRVDAMTNGTKTETIWSRN
jgi:hypothetical protein